MGLSTDISVRFVATQTTSEDGRNDTLRRSVIVDKTLGNGTGTGNADLVYNDPSRVLGVSASESLDLSGALEQPDGSACVFVKVKAIAIKNSGPGVLTFSRPANGAPIIDTSGSGIDIASGGSITLDNPVGWAITAGTGDLVQLAADASGCTYAITVVGTSA